MWTLRTEGLWHTVRHLITFRWVSFCSTGHSHSEHRRSPRYSSINPSRKDSSCGVTELQDRGFATFDTPWTWSSSVLCWSPSKVQQSICLWTPVWRRHGGVLSSSVSFSLSNSFAQIAYYPVTGIPLEASHQDTGSAVTTRPPWIRPVRKKASSSLRSNANDSPTHSGSPERFSPSEFLNQTPTSSSNKPRTPNTFSSPAGSSSFVDSSMFLHQLEEDDELYTTPELTFHDVVDSAALYEPDYLQGSPNLSQLENLGGTQHEVSGNSSTFLTMTGVSCIWLVVVGNCIVIFFFWEFESKTLVNMYEKYIYTPCISHQFIQTASECLNGAIRFSKAFPLFPGMR